MNQTEAEDIKKRWQEYTEGLYKKDLHDPENHDGMIMHLETDILEWKIKWGIGRKEKYTHLNARFQRPPRRDKKGFLSDQCKEIEENNRMGKTSNLFKKIRDTKGTFHAKMGSIKNRNSMNLTEAEDVKKKRRQEYTEELYKKDLHDS